MTVEQDGLADEILTQEDDLADEGVQDEDSATDERSEEKSDEPEVSLDDLFEQPQKQEIPASEKPKKGYIQSQATKIREVRELLNDGIIDSEEYESKKEDILSEFPALKGELSPLIQEIEAPSRLKELEAKVQAYEAEKVQKVVGEDMDEAKSILSERLEELGMAKKDFVEQFGKKFTDIIAKRTSTLGDSKASATAYALNAISKEIKAKKEEAKQKETSVFIPQRRGVSSTRFEVLSVEAYSALPMEKRIAYSESCEKELGELTFK